MNTTTTNHETIKKFKGKHLCQACQGLCGEIADFEVYEWYFCHYHLAELFKDYVNGFELEVPEPFVEQFVIKPQI